MAAFILSITALKAQDKTSDKGFSKIGETSVDFKTGNAVINVSGDDMFKSLHIKTPDAPVHIESISVVYQDGAPQKIPVRYDFKAGTESRDITLTGKSNIKEVDVAYKNVPNDKSTKATIEILGSK